MDTLFGGQSVFTDQEIRSLNSLYSLILQWDGNLVLYTVTRDRWYAHWASNTATGDPNQRAVRATMQQDGNFVLYTASDEPVWDFARGPGWQKSEPRPGSWLVLQNDRNLVIRDPYWSTVWDTATSVPDLNYYAEAINKSGFLRRSQGVRITLSAPFAFAEQMECGIVLSGGRGYGIDGAKNSCKGCHDLEVVHTEFGLVLPPPKETVGYYGHIQSAGYRRDIQGSLPLT